MNVQNKEKGFTIIEVVLVLAIAGLIFLMVFIALPALQRNQRDTARKNDVSVIASAVTSYTSNNRGTFPTAAKLSTYLNDLSDNTDKVPVVNTTATVGQKISPADTKVTIVKGKTCGASDTTGTVLAAGTSRQIAVITKLESGNGQYFCQTS